MGRIRLSQKRDTDITACAHLSLSLCLCLCLCLSLCLCLCLCLSLWYGLRHSATRSYNQSVCCSGHQKIREAVEFVIPYYQRKGVPIALADGSLVGVARHHHQQVPWTLDADLYVFLDVTTEFTSANFEGVLMSLNNNRQNSRHQILQQHRNGERNASWFTVAIDGFMAVDIFVLIGLPAGAPWPERRLFSRGASWRNINPSIPYAQVLPLGNCYFYGTLFKAGCSRDIKGFLRTMYGPGVMKGPNYFKDGADISKQAVFLAAKQREVVVFFRCSAIWAFLICVLAVRRYRCPRRGSSSVGLLDRSGGRQYRPCAGRPWARCCCTAVGLPLFGGIGYVVYKYNTELRYTLGINYGIALAELVAPGWFVDINMVH